MKSVLLFIACSGLHYTGALSGKITYKKADVDLNLQVCHVPQTTTIHYSIAFSHVMTRAYRKFTQSSSPLGGINSCAFEICA